MKNKESSSDVLINLAGISKEYDAAETGSKINDIENSSDTFESNTDNIENKNDDNAIKDRFFDFQIKSLKNDTSKSNKIIQSVGRPPWFDEHWIPRDPFIIGIAGGSASGKTTVANHIMKHFNMPWVTLIALDCFYKPITDDELEAAFKSEYDFDHPSALDFDLILDVVKRLKQGKMAMIPQYSFKTHSRLKEWKEIYGASIIIIEGIMTFHRQDLCDLIDMKIFIDTESDVRISRRLLRDIKERQRSIPMIIKQYLSFVKPTYDKYVADHISIADIVIPWNQDNFAAIDMIVKSVKRELSKMGLNIRKKLLSTYDPSIELKDMRNIHLLEQSSDLLATISVICDRNSTHSSFVFYAKKMMRNLLFKTLNIMSYYSVELVGFNDENVSYGGKKFSNEMVSGISINSGEPFEDIAFDINSRIKLGKILIQSNVDSGEPELHYLKLPADIHKSQVILFDDKIISGSSALMAIKVLQEHDVKLQDIFLVSIFANKFGLFTLTTLCPEVSIICSCIDDNIITSVERSYESFHFGQRYFGM